MQKVMATTNISIQKLQLFLLLPFFQRGASSARRQRGASLCYLWVKLFPRIWQSEDGALGMKLKVKALKRVFCEVMGCGMDGKHEAT
jgi:hypothetical protein